LTKIVDRQAGILDDSAHRKGIHWTVARDRQCARTVRHDNVLALASDPEASLLERTHGVKVADAGELRHGSGSDLDLSDLSSFDLLHHHRKVLAQSVGDVDQGFRFGGSLRDATRKTRDPNTEAFFGFAEGDLVFHLRAVYSQSTEDSAKAWHRPRPNPQLLDPQERRLRRLDKLSERRVVEQARALWRKAKVELKIPDLPPAPVDAEQVRGTGANTPS
jgi:hypothetical protein